MAIGNQQDQLLKLILAIQQADESALSRLYDLLIARMYTVAYRMINSTTDAEEVVCDALNQIWKQAKNYNPDKGSVISWCMMITRSRALDYWRRRNKVQTHNVETLDSLANNDSEPEEIITMFEQYSNTRQLMATLPAVQRQLLALSFFRGLSHQEISDCCNIPLGTAKSHIKRALEKLQKSAISTPIYVGFTGRE